MEYQELVTELSDRTRYTRREMRAILRHLAVIIRDTLGAGRDVNVEGLGVFLNLPQKQRVGRHPRTKKEMIIPPTRRVRFEPCKALKQTVRDSDRIFRIEDPAKKYGLAKEKTDGEVRSADRPKEGRAGKAGGKRFPRRRPERQRPHGSGEGD